MSQPEGLLMFRPTPSSAVDGSAAEEEQPAMTPRSARARLPTEGFRALDNRFASETSVCATGLAISQRTGAAHLHEWTGDGTGQIVGAAMSWRCGASHTPRGSPCFLTTTHAPQPCRWRRLRA